MIAQGRQIEAGWQPRPAPAWTARSLPPAERAWGLLDEQGRKRRLADYVALATAMPHVAALRAQTLARRTMLAEIVARANIQDVACRACGAYDPAARPADVELGQACWGQSWMWQDRVPDIDEMSRCKRPQGRKQAADNRQQAA